MATLLLTRHGETEWNRARRWQGRLDSPLTKLGRRQANELAEQVDDVDAVYSSDSGRARETAAIVAARLGHEVRVEPRLAEVDFGAWEGLTTAEIDERHPGATDRWNAGAIAPTDGERDEAMAERVLQALRDIAERHPEGRVLVVTSGGPVRAAEAHARGVDQREARRLVATIGNCSLLELVVRGDAFEAADSDTRDERDQKPRERHEADGGVAERLDDRSGGGRPGDKADRP
jgi:probable phosphoglycerate mutase